MSGTHKYPTISFRISPREREEIEAKGTFDRRYGCRKCFCVTFDKSNKTAVSGENFL